jgi:hypothetical protein
METIARRRHRLAGLAVVIGIALSLLLLVAASRGWNWSSDTPVRIGTSPAIATDGSSESGPAAVPVNPWAANDPATIRPLCTRTSLDLGVREAIRGSCTGRPAKPWARGIQ